MAGSAAGWRRVSEHVAAERGRRNWSVTQLARAADLSPRTIEYVEAASRGSYSPATIGKLESALGWAPGSIDQIRGGGKPIPEYEPGSLTRLRRAWPKLTAAEQDAVAGLVEAFIGRH